MIILSFLALMTLCTVRADTCKYEFHVPESSGVSCGNTASPELEYKFNRVQSQLVIAQERTATMHDSLSKELTRLYRDVEALKATTGVMESQLLQMNAATRSVEYLNEEVHNLKNMLMNTSESLGGRFSGMQEKMMDIMDKLQTQPEKMNTLSSVQQQLGNFEKSLASQKNRTDELVKELHVVSSLEEQINGMNRKTEQNDKDLTEIKEMLNSLVVEPPLPETVARLNRTMKLIQNIMTNGLRNDGNKIRKLTTDLETLKQNMNNVKTASQTP